MPIVNADGCAIYVEVDGPERAPALMLSNSLGTTLHMWDAQVAPFTRYFRLVRYDRRGHGRSGVPKGPYTMDRLGRDVLAVLDALGIERVNWCGLSMGGMVGQWLGANAPERIERLVLTNTSSYFADKTMWNERLKLVREKGVAAFAAANMERWFTKGFRERSPKVVAWMQEMFAATPLEGYLACGEAVRDMDHRELLQKSKRRRSSLRASMIRQPRRRRTNTSRITSRAPASPCSMPRIFRTSSRRRHTRARSWNFCRGNNQFGYSSPRRRKHRLWDYGSRASRSAGLPDYPPLAARNSCGVVPVCLRKKRAKWDGSEKARS